MNKNIRLLSLAISLGIIATQAHAQMPGYKASLSLALTINQEIGAYPATSSQKLALETKGGTLADVVNPSGYVVPPNGTQYYSFRTTPTGPITFTPGLTGTYVNEIGLVIKSTPYTNASFLSDAVKAGQLTAGQATGAKLIAIRLAGNYDESRIYLFVEGAKTAPDPIFFGILDDRNLEDSTDPKYYVNMGTDSRLLLVGQYGTDGFGRATVGRTQKIKTTVINNEATHTTTSAGGTTITGLALKFFPNDTNDRGFTVAGPLTIKDGWSAFGTTKNMSFSATGLSGVGQDRGANDTIRGSVAITTEVAVADLSRYFSTTGIPAGPGGLVTTK